MIAYLYAITDLPRTALPDQAGLGGARLSEVVWHDIAAVVSDHDALPSSACADDFWRHENVIEALMDRRAVLPVRFGTALSSHLDVVDLLCRRCMIFSQDLERLRGCVEIGLRLLPRTADDAPAVALEQPAVGPGTAFLRAKLARQRDIEARRTRVLERVRDVHEGLARLAIASHVAAGGANQDTVSVAFLVPRDAVDGFRVAVGEIAPTHPEITLFCTGPWPPYSFVSATADQSAPCDGDCRDRVN